MGSRCAPAGALLIAVVSILAGAAPAAATFPGENGKIAFAGTADGDYEIYTVNPDGSDLAQLTHNSAQDRDPAWSADGRYIAFTRDGAVYAMDATGANQTQVYFSGSDPQWSPNGEELAWVVDFDTIFAANANGGFRQILTSGDLQSTYDLDWSAGPQGGVILFSRSDGHVSPSTGVDVYVLNGATSSRITDYPGHEVNVSWAPDQSAMAFARDSTGFGSGNDGIWRWYKCCQIPLQVTNDPEDLFPVWSPDGTKLAVSGYIGSSADIAVMNVDGTDRTPIVTGPATEIEPDWQAAPGPPPQGYARPKAASPIATSLVPAYRPCDEPTSEHGPPLAFPSCSPPAQTSDYLTVGTPDANGQAPKYMGSAKVTAVVGDAATPADEADVKVQATLVDVRCKAAQAYPCAGADLADYTGDLQLAFDARITDRRVNFFGQAEQLTTTDIYRFPVAFSCAATADATIGSSCSLDTTIDALVPGAIKERARTIWQLGHIEVRDGGEDGAASSDDYTIFATQGVFVP